MKTPNFEEPHDDEVATRDQTFKKVGTLKAEKTDLKHAPKNFDLYQDTESGALIGKLPDNHPSEKLTEEMKQRSLEDQIESLDIDLTTLSGEEIHDLLRNGNPRLFGKMRFGEN